MAILLNCDCIGKLQIVASSALPNDSSSSSSRHPHPHFKSIKLPQTNNKKPEHKQQQQPPPPSILEIERAIGAGIFRDSKEEQVMRGESVIDNALRKSVGNKEDSVEKKLRETGEWLIHQSENTSRAAGKNILMTMFLLLIPMWIFAFLVASGTLQLPFDTPFLDDLVS